MVSALYRWHNLGSREQGREELEGKVVRWRYALESRGLKISRKKAEYMPTKLDGNQQTTTKLGGGNIRRVHKFTYLGSVIDNEGNVEEEINNQIQCGWNNWRKVSGVICDRKVPIRLKGRLHKRMVRPAMTEGRKLDVTKVKMLSWMSGVTKKERNGELRAEIEVAGHGRTWRQSRGEEEEEEEEVEEQQQREREEVEEEEEEEEVEWEEEEEGGKA
ncbi:uncharacterized protein C53C9.2-like [Macrobrachium nipponense]|uniref:uncharacterized protein C53C9.2-like n=1 Tax=Macrobrachium nipponense TaxID=159736 RepID=UPI0030C85822